MPGKGMKGRGEIPINMPPVETWRGKENEANDTVQGKTRLRDKLFVRTPNRDGISRHLVRPCLLGQCRVTPDAINQHAQGVSLGWQRSHKPVGKHWRPWWLTSVCSHMEINTMTKYFTAKSNGLMFSEILKVRTRNRTNSVKK